ncbi:MAG: RNA-binding protein [Rhodocyclaceae bacterium]|nr:RNA-binding protein [Rhodocyclaceae bacterium]
MGKKLYVSNLAYSVGKADLELLFAPFGTVGSAQIITDRASGKSKGFGFIEMGSDSEAQAAIAGLNGKDLAGRGMAVSEARTQEARSSRDSGEGSQSGGSASG